MTPDMLILPGEVIRDEFLAPRSMTLAKLADAAGVPIADLEAIVAGSASIDGAMSTRIGRALGMSDAFFANLQAAYDRDLAQVRT